ncbi:MAG: hypothetical protein FJ135_08125 [Deltaproteobacteria bacterium]|nr:hypothetical protein [Deltaproteobacteria bacterium]
MMQDKLDHTYRTNKIISLALAASLLLYAIIVEIIKFQQLNLNLVAAPIVDKLRFVFVFFSFAAYFIINFVRQRVLVKRDDDTQERLLGKLSLANIVSMALAELPAFFGLLLFLGSGNSRDFYPLAIISLVLFYMFFPSHRAWAAWSGVTDQETSG